MPLPLRALHHVALICSDYHRSKHFYTHILGLEIIREVHRPERNSYKLDLRPPAPPAGSASFRLELFSFPSPPPRPTRPEARGLRHIAFAVADIDAAIAHLAQHNIPCEPVRIDEHTNARFTFFRDPDDLPIELYEEV